MCEVLLHVIIRPCKKYASHRLLCFYFQKATKCVQQLLSDYRYANYNIGETRASFWKTSNYIIKGHQLCILWLLKRGSIVTTSTMPGLVVTVFNFVTINVKSPSTHRRIYIYA